MERSYFWKNIYVPFYEQLVDLPTVADNGNIKDYAIGEGSSTSFMSVEEFRQNPPLGSMIARHAGGLNINQRISPEEWERIEWVDELLDSIDMIAKRLRLWRDLDG